ncbi:MAG: hypothetical protein ACI9ND_002189, partial [Yoonia sp.]
CSKIIRTARARTSVENRFALLLLSIGSIHTYFKASGKLGAVQKARKRRCLFLRSSVPLATPVKRKYQLATEAIFAAWDRSNCPFTGKVKCNCETAERTAAQDLAISNLS